MKGIWAEREALAELQLSQSRARYPHTAGCKEDTTSRQAAEAIEATGRAGTLMHYVMCQFQAGHELTADEVADRLEESPLSIRPRVSQLYKLGKIERTGERRASSEGRPSHVYRVKVAV